MKWNGTQFGSHTLNIGGDNRKELEHQTRHQGRMEFWHFGGVQIIKFTAKPEWTGDMLNKTSKL
jgi:hypothetical protein